MRLGPIERLLYDGKRFDKLPVAYVEYAEGKATEIRALMGLKAYDPLTLEEMSDYLGIAVKPQTELERLRWEEWVKVSSILLNHPEGASSYHQRMFEQESEYLALCLMVPRRGIWWASNKPKSLMAVHFKTDELIIDLRFEMLGMENGDRVLH